MLVCDLQGVPLASTDGWLLTDPAAHSQKVGSLGPTDCGPMGIEAFFHSHTCNNLCRGLSKPTLKSNVSPMQASTNSSFGWQMCDASSLVHHQSGGTCYAHACATV